MRDFLLPSLGADMDDGMLADWLVEAGDTVSRGQVIAEVETDKGIIEVEVWEDAVVDELLVQPSDERLAVGTPIARLRELDEEAAAESPAGSPAGEPTAAEVPAEVPAAGESEVEPARHMVGAGTGAGTIEPVASHSTPPVRHLAHQLGVDLAAVHATGPGGAITRGDVRRAAAGEGVDTRPHRPRMSPRARRLAHERGVDPASVSASRPDGMIVADDVVGAIEGAPDEGPAAPAPPRPEPTDKAAAMRRAIARSMERSKREIPHYYLSARIDLLEAMSWLEEANEELPVTRRILPAALLLKASALALREFPDLNGHWIDGAFTPSPNVHLGVAVSLRGGGLVAPAIHDADTLSLDEMMRALSDLVARARAGRLRGSEMSQQTCTVTNLGDRGVDATFPVIIPPQVAIIGFGRSTDAPVVADGQVAVHPVVHASLAGDHRVTDGHTGGLLLLAIDRLLQEPDQL